MLESQNLQGAALDYLTLWREYPAQVNQILADLADYRFALRVNTSEHADLKRAWNRRTRALVTAIVSVSVAILLAVQVNRGGPAWLTRATGAILALLWAYTYLQYRRLK
jgi:hypothetical protein